MANTLCAPQPHMLLSWSWCSVGVASTSPTRMLRAVGCLCLRVYIFFIRVLGERVQCVVVTGAAASPVGQTPVQRHVGRDLGTAGRAPSSSYGAAPGCLHQVRAHLLLTLQGGAVTHPRRIRACLPAPGWCPQAGWRPVSQPPLLSSAVHRGNESPGELPRCTSSGWTGSPCWLPIDIAVAGVHRLSESGLCHWAALPCCLMPSARVVEADCMCACS